MADKTKSIKEATDKQLDELIIRLRKESELQNIITDMKRRSSSGYIGYDYMQEVSTEAPIESLYHYGKLGMRWGIRKRKGPSVVKSRILSKVKPSSPNKPASVQNESEDHKKKLTYKTKKLSEMSNAELKEFTQRLNLEKQYRDLTKTEVSAGRKFVNDILTNTAKNIATKYATEYGTRLVDSMLKSAGGK